MANKLQKVLYYSSATVPLCFSFAIVWYLQKGTHYVPVILLIIGIVLTILTLLSFSYGKKNLAPIQIRTSDISPNDGWIIAYVISYIFPFTNIVIEELDLILCGGIAFLLIVMVPFINTAIPNPILFVKGYHFYQISAGNGVSGYILISKKES